MLYIWQHLHGQIPFERFGMGTSAKAYASRASDVSNPNSWEETQYILHDPVVLFGKRASETQLSFWNDRLYMVRMAFPENEWSDLAHSLQQRYGEPWQIDSLKKEGYWGSSQKRVSTHLSGQNVVVYVHDETQKDFHWQDMFRGVLLYVLLAIVGLFALFLLISRLLASFCPRCKSFGMELLDGVERSNPTRYYEDASLFSASTIEHDTTYKYKCKHCGYLQRDTYSGWWEAYRKTV
jgi:hypothetical protein